MRSPSEDSSTDFSATWGFRQDRRRVGKPGLWGELRAATHRGVWAMGVFRLGRWLFLRADRPVGRILQRPCELLTMLSQVVTRIEIWPNTVVGPGLLLSPHGHIVVNARVHIGANCSLGRGVTLGVARAGDWGTPTLEDGVELGNYAQVYGPVLIGAEARVAPMAVVLADVPAGVLVAGIPARVVTNPPAVGTAQANSPSGS